MISISYAVTTHNEHKEIEELIPFILNNKDKEDELVILDDYSSYETWRVFDEYIHIPDANIKFVERGFHGDFSTHKNFMNDQCSGDWIVNIDADEMPNKFLMSNIKGLLEANPEVELFWVPRVNTVKGITPQHARQWHYKINEQGWVNWPDPQQRIYKNKDDIKWTRRVHERLIGAKKDAFLPYEEQWCFYHHKTIEKQEAQNKLYGDIQAN